MNFKNEQEELEYLRSITRCKYFFLNPNYPDKSSQTYSKCNQVKDHKGECKES
jgi:hypothetical protein